MGTAVRKQLPASRPDEVVGEVIPFPGLASLGKLASADIETKLVGDLSRDLHAMFDPVTSATLPIYFGPLLGRLYLEGL